MFENKHGSKTTYGVVGLGRFGQALARDLAESGAELIVLDSSEDKVREMAFLTMSMCEIFHSFNLRSQRNSVFRLHGQNPVLWAAMIGSLILTTAVLEIPFLANAFGFTPVGAAEYGIALCLAVLVIPVVEAVKFFQRRHRQKK